MSARTPSRLAILVMMRAGLVPLEPFPGSNEPWLCLHTSCGREVATRHSYVRQFGGGCLHCAGQIIDPSDASALLRSRGYEPLSPTPEAEGRGDAATSLAVGSCALVTTRSSKEMAAADTVQVRRSTLTMRLRTCLREGSSHWSPSRVHISPGAAGTVPAAPSSPRSTTLSNKAPADAPCVRRPANATPNSQRTS